MYNTGTIDYTNTSTAIVGHGTSWSSAYNNQFISLGGQWYRINTVTDATHLTLKNPYRGTSATTSTYVIDISPTSGLNAPIGPTGPTGPTGPVPTSILLTSGTLNMSANGLSGFFNSNIAALVSTNAGTWAQFNLKGTPLNLNTNVSGANATNIGGALTVSKDVAVPAGGNAAQGLFFGSATGFGIYFGSGAPTISAGQGSLYLRSDGSSTSTRMYVNTNGATTWTAVTTSA